MLVGTTKFYDDSEELATLWEEKSRFFVALLLRMTTSLGCWLFIAALPQNDN
jgi:hypothetical protein